MEQEGDPREQCGAMHEAAVTQHLTSPAFKDMNTEMS